MMIGASRAKRFAKFWQSCKRTGSAGLATVPQFQASRAQFSGKSEQHELLRFSKGGLARIARSPVGRIEEEFRGEIPGAGEEPTASLG